MRRVGMTDMPMLLETGIAFLATVLLLMVTPVPSQLLMLSQSAANGLSRGLFVAAGDLTANFLQMLCAGLGVAALIMASATALTVIKWLGVAYLLHLGVTKLRAKPTETPMLGGSPAHVHARWLQGFITSAANPKAVVFFAALFPQFVDPAAAFWPQFAVLSATYLVIDGLFLTVYGGLAGWLAKRFAGRSHIWLDRAGGVVMIAAAILLSFKSLRTS